MTFGYFIGKLFARLLHNFPYIFFVALFFTIIIAIAYYVILWKFGWLPKPAARPTLYRLRRPARPTPSIAPHPRPVVAKRKPQPAKKTVSHARFKKKQLEKKKKRAEALKAFEK